MGRDEKCLIDKQKDCVNYPESLSELFNNAKARNEELEKENEALSSACDELRKSYSKQHDFYRDIFISLVKVERENEQLKVKLNA
jgi:predicted RNase H-like nuclease (RuvC/YqgF family)